MNLRFTRRAFLPLAVAVTGFLGVHAEGDVAPQQEWSFVLTRFNYLTLTLDSEDYRIAVVEDSKDGEFKRTVFNGFKLRNSTPTSANFLQRYDSEYQKGEEQLIELALIRDVNPGTPNNRSVNYGHWRLTITGAGSRYQALKALIIQGRIEELWQPADSMELRGELLEEREN